MRPNSGSVLYLAGVGCAPMQASANKVRIRRPKAAGAASGTTAPGLDCFWVLSKLPMMQVLNPAHS